MYFITLHSLRYPSYSHIAFILRPSPHKKRKKSNENAEKNISFTHNAFLRGITWGKLCKYTYLHSSSKEDKDYKGRYFQGTLTRIE